MTALNRRQRRRLVVIWAALLVAPVALSRSRRALRVAQFRRSESRRGATGSSAPVASNAWVGNVERLERTAVARASDLPLQSCTGAQRPEPPALERRSLLRAVGCAATSRHLRVAASVLSLVFLGAGAAVLASNASAGKPHCPGNSCRSTTTTTATSTSSTAGTASTPTYFTTLASGAAGLPLSDSTCASLVPTSTWEPRTDNTSANHTMPVDPSTVPWSTNSSTTYWTKFIAKRKLVTGHYTGTTDQIIQWAACKWGIDENLLRAVAVQESDWHMSAVGDACGPRGEASYGLFQVKNADCSGTTDAGGYTYTAQDSALNADYYAMNLRSCLDGDFYDGGSWLYGGKTIAQIISTNGLDYAVWGCVGAWYSGRWYDSGAQSYIKNVKTWLAAKTWLNY
jgi:Transglycosylase SLT domain